MTHDLWTNLNRRMVDYLDSVTLQDLVDQQRMRQLNQAPQTNSILMQRKTDSLTSVIV